MIGELYESGNVISRDGDAMTTLRLDTLILDKPLSERNVRAKFLVILRVDINWLLNKKEKSHV